MDILISSSNLRAINYLKRHCAVQVDPLNNLWGLTVRSMPETLADLAEIAPDADGWIAAVTDFEVINPPRNQNPPSST